MRETDRDLRGHVAYLRNIDVMTISQRKSVVIYQRNKTKVSGTVDRRTLYNKEKELQVSIVTGSERAKQFLVRPTLGQIGNKFGFVVRRGDIYLGDGQLEDLYGDNELLFA